MSISTRSSILLRSTTTLNNNNFNRALSATRRTKALLPTPHKTATVVKAKLKLKHTRKRPKKTANTSQRAAAIKKTANNRMISSAGIDKGSAGQAQFSQVKNKFPNYRRKSSAIRIPSSGAGPQQHHHHQQPQNNMNNNNNSFLMNPPTNPFNRQSSFGSVPSTLPLSNNMSMSNSNSTSSPLNAALTSFQFNPTAFAAAAVTLVQMIQNAAQNKELQQTQQQQQHQQSQPPQMPQHRNQMHPNRRNVNASRYPPSASSFVSNNSSNAMNINAGFNNQQLQFANKNYPSSPFMQQQQQKPPLLNNPPHQMLVQPNSVNKNQSQAMPYNHRYSTRFKHARASLPPAKDKKTAPYNTTQYIMHDYFKRRAIDQECPNEQQQFSDEWNMALATNAASSSTNSLVMNLEILKENATRSTLEDEQTRREHEQMNLSMSEAENVGDMMMSVDDDALLKSNGGRRDDDGDSSAGIKLSSSI